jgi:TonB family protein
MNGNAPSTPLIEITDPVAHFKYILNTVGKTADRQPVAAEYDPANRPQNDQRPNVINTMNDPVAALGTGSDATASAPNRPAPDRTSENLGTQTIEGLLCEGARITVTWPVGSRGNDRPFSVISELWISAEVQIPVLSKMTNPQTGERTQKVINISRAEPSPELFQVPAEYTVTDRPTFMPPAGANGAYRIGGDVSAPALISKVEPTYSDEARQEKLSGSVLLSIVVDPSGMPRDIKVLRPLGSGLDESAIAAVMQWRFRPGMKDGQPVPVMARIQVSFRLLDKKQ